MNKVEGLRAIVEYLLQTETSPMTDTVSLKQPEFSPEETNADLHVHPYISSKKDLVHTLKVVADNNVEVCAITCHGAGSPEEASFEDVKKLIEDGLSQDLNYKELDHAFKVEYEGIETLFVGGHEMYVTHPGLKGKLCMVTLMPNEGFREVAENGHDFNTYLRINRDYEGIVIGAHPHTLWDPYGPQGSFKFRHANDDERAALRGDVFPRVDTVDTVASNVLWMVRCDETVLEDYEGQPLANSDAHGRNKEDRREIGRAGNLFILDDYDDGEDLREQFRDKICTNDFRTYLNYMPLNKFISSIALPDGPNGLP